MGRPSTNQSASVFVLYRFYAADDSLLYVGLTRNPARRFEKHSGDKEWWKDVARIELQHFTDLSELKDAERAAIVDEKPLHNIRMNGKKVVKKSAGPDPMTAVETDGLVGMYFHSLEEPAEDAVTIVRGQQVKWQGRVLEEITPELYRVETYSWWDGCATGAILAKVDDMVSWAFYESALEMQVALPCGEHHDHGRVCRGEREYYHDMRNSLGTIHFICYGCRKRYPGFADYKELVWRDGKPHLK